MHTDVAPSTSPAFDLARRICAGDGYAFEEFVERHLRGLFAATLAQGICPDAAERTTEAALVTILWKVRQRRGVLALTSWIEARDGTHHPLGDRTIHSMDSDRSLRVHEAAYTAWRRALFAKRQPWWIAASVGFLAVIAGLYIGLLPRLAVPVPPAPTPSFGSVRSLEELGSYSYAGLTHYRRFYCAGHPLHAGDQIPEWTRVYTNRTSADIASTNSLIRVAEGSEVRMMEQGHVAVDGGEVLVETTVPGLLVDTPAGRILDGGARFEVRSGHVYLPGSSAVPITRLRVWRGTVRLEFDRAVYLVAGGEEVIVRPGRGIQRRTIS
jgi:hypothetical protein